MATATTCETITCQELQAKIAAGEKIRIVDVRTPVEFREVHIETANNVPLDRIGKDDIIPSDESSEDAVYVVCRSGNRAKQAIEKLEGAGCSNLVNVEGGMVAWESSKLPVIRGKKAMSLERQVRIAAGTLVFTGAMLGFFVAKPWIFLSAFVGAGLVFAGVTDTCAMGMLIAKMPWNQVKKQCDAS